MGPYNARPKWALFLRVALIKAGVRRGVGLIRAIKKREYHVFEKLSFFEILKQALLRPALKGPALN